MEKIQDRNASDFALSLKGLRTEKRKTLIKQRIKEMRDSYKLGTLKTYFTAYRKAFPKLAHLFTLDAAETAGIQSSYVNKVQKRTEANDLARLSPKQAAELVKLANKLAQSIKPLEVVLGLALLTGRRTSEVLFSAGFEGKSKAFEAMFSGASKQKDGKQLNAFNIPLLCPLEVVTSGIKFIRLKCGVASHTEANNRFAKQLGILCQKHFGENTKPHDLRKMYAAFAYAKTDKAKSFRAFAQTVLGHLDNGLTTETYFKYVVE